MLLLLSQIAIAETTSYRMIHGTWTGVATIASRQMSIQFNILDAPCVWGQLNETPYILSSTTGKTQIISTVALPDGSIVLSSFTASGFNLTPAKWDEFSISGNAIETGSSAQGTFTLIKSQTLTGDFCYHKDAAVIRQSRKTFDVRLLIIANGDKEYCCSNGVFSSCTFRDSCEFSTMDEQYALYQFTGRFNGVTCTGAAVRENPLPPISIGKFDFSIKSTCRRRPVAE